MRAEYDAHRSRYADEAMTSVRVILLKPAAEGQPSVKDRASDILKKLGDKWPETKVLLLAVFPRGADENDGFRKQVNEINAGLPALCDGKRVTFLNFNDKFLSEDGVLSRDVMPDLLHPAPAQYNIWAEAVEPYIKEALGE